jgi:hypothetical protein
MSSRTSQPEWLHERNNDPYGTTLQHPFWSTVDAEDIGTYRVFKRDGKWYAYDRRWNAWYGFASITEAVEHAQGGSKDPWA